MRTNLFLSTLFAVSLVGGVALAEKPTHDHPAREPRAIQALRAHGDTVDKSYVHADKASHASNASSSVRETKSPLRDTAASRINCSDTGADCGRASRPAQASHGSAGASHGNADHGSLKSPLQKQADSRMNCNEADECSASSKSAQSKWSGGHGAKVGKDAPTSLTPRDAQPRMLGQAGGDRMACNEADECMMSSKASKKIWALESIKAGTFHHMQTGDVVPTKGQKTAERAAQQRDREHNAADRQH
jgi:hypothetical protein